MMLAFQAKFVDCVEAIGGDLLQVTFDTVPRDHDETARQTPYLMISRLFEFPDTASTEWHDGQDYNGGAEVVSGVLSRSGICIRLDQGLDVEVTFELSDERYAELTSFLKRMLEDQITFAKRIPEQGAPENPAIASRLAGQASLARGL